METILYVLMLTMVAIICFWSVRNPGEPRDDATRGLLAMRDGAGAPPSPGERPRRAASASPKFPS